jgi:hypothetical protein
MAIANFPDWATAMTFKDGTQAWFDGPKDLFIGLLELKRYTPNLTLSDINAFQVKDYYGLGVKAALFLGMLLPAKGQVRRAISQRQATLAQAALFTLIVGLWMTLSPLKL